MCIFLTSVIDNIKLYIKLKVLQIWSIGISQLYIMIYYHAHRYKLNIIYVENRSAMSINIVN